MMSSDPSRAIRAKQSPPMPVEPGSTTHCTAHAAIAASSALPPAASVCTAASVAEGCEVAAIPCRATTKDLPGFSKFRMLLLQLPVAPTPIDVLSAKS
jgi:hypothetical protein